MAPSPKEEFRMEGVAASPGLAHGPAVVMTSLFEEPIPSKHDGDVEAQWRMLMNSLVKTKGQIKELQETFSKQSRSEDASIFEVHVMLLEDETMLREVRRRTETEGDSVEWSFWSHMARSMESLRKLPDSYFSERAQDVRDVAERVIRNLRGDSTLNPTWVDTPHILVAQDLTPSDSAGLDPKIVRGLALQGGSVTSHSVIMAHALGIPCVVGLANLLDHIASGDELLLDGFHGLLVSHPLANSITEFADLQQKSSAVTIKIEREQHLPACTADGHVFTLSANLEFPAEVELLGSSSAEGVGLYRTEYGYFRNPNATEDELAEEYSEIARRAHPSGVIFRTFDIGGDKISGGEPVHEPNPFLGWRGIRISLTMPALFRRQLRAILRASAHGKVSIMFPMIASLEELLQARHALATAAAELEAAGIPYDNLMAVGSMIEIPSAALITDLLAPHVDFFSLGTNDLVQYTLAVDRMNERVAKLYQPTHPAVLRLIQQTVISGHRHGKWVGICGEMASDISLLPLLAGLDINEFSVAPSQVARVKYALRRLHVSDCRRLARQALNLADPSAILELSRRRALKCYPDLLL